MIAATLGGAALAAGTLAYAVRSPRSSLLAASVFRGVSQRRSIALTFDDGPSESTPELLEILGRHGAVATFFQCGRNVRRLPSIAKDAVAAGHELGNHTDTHPYLHFQSRAFMLEEIMRAQEAILEAASVIPRWFRAPYGVRWFGLGEVQERVGVGGVMWTDIGLDWKLSAEAVASRLLGRVRPGAIVCLHDGRLTAESPDVSVTLEAVSRLLPVWKDQGIQFETVSQILCPTN